MPRLVLLGDVHYTRAEPECRGPSYPREILAKLHEGAELAQRLSAPAVVLAGDVFHRKGRTSFQEANDLLGAFAGWRERRGVEALGIVGNHDVLGNGLESLDARAAGALHHAGVYGVLDFQNRFFQGGDGSIHLTGTSYFSGGDRDDEGRLRTYGAPPPEDPAALHVHVAHGALRLEGGFPAEHTRADELVPLLAEADRLPDVIFCGHMHDREGIAWYDRPDGRGKVAVVRTGALCRVSRDDLGRQPVAVVLASKGRSFILREVPIGKPVALPRDLPEGDPRRPDEREERIRGFVASLAEQGEEWSLSDPREVVREAASRLGHGEDVVRRALEAVDRVS